MSDVDINSDMDDDAGELSDADQAGDLLADLEAIAPESASPYLAWLADYPLAQTGVAAALVLLLATVVYFFARRYLVALIGMITRRSFTWWDQVLVDHQVFHRLVPLLPALIVYRGVTFVPHLSDAMTAFIARLTMATIVVIVVRAIGALLTAINVIYSRYPIARGRPIKGYLQVVKILAYIAGGILIVATLIDQSPWFFLSGLGAMTAVILLIFRDTLLSLVAGMQLVNNDLVRVGDWIEMPQFEADGDVIDISLNVVKVLNWDRTVTVIPAHKFLEHSFRNWRSMHESGGRRIKRCVNIDMTTIRFLDEEQIRRFSRFTLLKEYMQQKSEELDTHNRSHVPEDDADVIANARHLTNVGTFRAYIIEYLRQHPSIHKDRTFLVRQLQPSEHGLPIEIYVFANDTLWANYEAIQSDVFDHVLAIIGEFGLRAFQDPTGYDLSQLGLAPGRGRRRERAAAAAGAGDGDEGHGGHGQRE